jgi:hypothetical protein
MGPTGVSEEKAMDKHRSLLRRTVVIPGVKTKITIIRKQAAGRPW